MDSTFARLTLALLAAVTAAGCSNDVPLGPSTPPSATTGSSPTTPTPTTPSPSTSTAAAVAYTPDLQPIFNSDCVPCHGARSPAARYSMATYTGVMAAVAPGNASSALVIVTQSGGAMHAFLSGDQAGKAALIRTWVMNGAPQSR
jgi:mono/diheme cytochrome c family protein